MAPETVKRMVLLGIARTGGKFQEYYNNRRRIRELIYFISFLLYFIYLNFVKFNLGSFRFF